MSPWRIAARIVLALHVGLLLGPLWTYSVTVNEFGHLPAGLSHWQTGSFDAYRVNPPLPRMLAALLVLPARPATDYHQLLTRPGFRPEWDLGYTFLGANAERYLDLFRLARLSGVLWSLAGAWLVGRWARQLYGEEAGWLALTLWCLNPLVLAFAPLVVPDLPATVAGLAAGYAYWRYLRRPSWRGAALAGVLLGVAQLTKFTLLVFYGVWPLLWLIQQRSRERREGVSPRLGTQAAQGALLFGLSLFLLNLGYGFAGSCRPLRDFTFVSRLFTGAPAGEGRADNRFRDGLLGSLPVPLPAAYMQGIDTQRGDFEGGHPSYLGGEWRYPGWWYYYLYALAVKLPLGILGLLLGNLGLMSRGGLGGARWTDEAALWLPAVAVLTLVSSQTGYNHHLRYALPLLPFVLVSTGKLAYFLRPGQWGKGAVVVLLLAWAGANALAMHPHYLAYFNEAAGGPDRGYRHLINSNLDWGQDLHRLKHWMDQHPEARPLSIAYYNFITPQAAGIEFELPPLLSAGTGRDNLRPGYYAVSVNFVRGLDFVLHDCRGRNVYVPHDAYGYFRRFRPMAKAGCSIFIYHLTADDANATRESP